MDPNYGVPWASGLGSGNGPASTGGFGSTGGFNFGGSMVGGGIGGLLGSLFTSNPADAANPYLNQLPSAVGHYMEPYSQAGSAMLNPLQQQYGQLTSNPGGMMNQIGSNFHQSPGFQFALNQALTGANRAAAAGGLAGSPSNQLQNMQTATQMGNQDYYNWLGNALGMYGQGLHGMQGMAGLGMQGATNMSNVIANQLAQQAAMAYQQQAQQNQGIMSGFGALGSLVGGFL